jgi:hypothetical protein
VFHDTVNWYIEFPSDAQCLECYEKLHGTHFMQYILVMILRNVQQVTVRPTPKPAPPPPKLEPVPPPKFRRSPARVYSRDNLIFEARRTISKDVTGVLLKDIKSRLLFTLVKDFVDEWYPSYLERIRKQEEERQKAAEREALELAAALERQKEEQRLRLEEVERRRVEALQRKAEAKSKLSKTKLAQKEARDHVASKTAVATVIDDEKFEKTKDDDVAQRVNEDAQIDVEVTSPILPIMDSKKTLKRTKQSLKRKIIQESDEEDSSWTDDEAKKSNVDSKPDERVEVEVKTEQCMDVDTNLHHKTEAAPLSAELESPVVDDSILFDDEKNDKRLV